MVAIPDDFLKSSVFLCVEEQAANGATQRIPSATAFLVSVPIEGAPASHVGYFITARHCLYEARASGHETIYLRFNLKGDGGFIEVPTKIDDWNVSDIADVAAILFIPAYLPGKRSFFEFDVMSYTLSHSVGPGPDYRYVGTTSNGFELNIQPRVGNEIYFIGLFTQQYGKEKNLPVARFGHISRMPSLIEFEDPSGITYESPAYLVEFHSWGGHSGSPVFFLEPQTFITIEVDDKDQPTGRGRTDTGWISGLLGLVSGHYDIAKKAKVTGELGTVETDLNSGMATIVPAEAINSLLMRDDFAKRRADLKTEIASLTPRPTPDFAGRDSEAQFTKADFENALRKVSRVEHRA